MIHNHCSLTQNDPRLYPLFCPVSYPLLWLAASGEKWSVLESQQFWCCGGWVGWTNRAGQQPGMVKWRERGIKWSPHRANWEGMLRKWLLAVCQFWVLEKRLRDRANGETASDLSECGTRSSRRRSGLTMTCTDLRCCCPSIPCSTHMHSDSRPG